MTSPNVSRVQVLDVGDRVMTHAEGQPLYNNREGVVVKANPHHEGYYLVAFTDERRQVNVDLGWRRDELTRIGGDVQVGDFVSTPGNAQAFFGVNILPLKGIIVGRAPEGAFMVSLLGDPAAVFTYSVNDLTRITRAEALA